MHYTIKFGLKVRRVVNFYSQRQPGAIYLDLRKRFGIDPGQELLMPDELIFVCCPRVIIHSIII